jgi:predicted Zn-ribbon and HTH transcriptional regulator
MEEILLPSLECKRCGHQWYPRGPKMPRVCPKCKSPYWNKEYTRADKVFKLAKARRRKKVERRR